MNAKTVEFEVLEGRREEMIEAIEIFTRAVHVSEPGSRLYVSLQDKSNLNKFTHIMAFENEGAELKHKTAGYTEEFVQILDNFCKNKPVFKEFNYVGGL